MHNDWHIISDITNVLPNNGDEVYCCIYDGKAVSDVRRIVVDIPAFHDLLTLNPTWKILWQPLAAPPIPPSPSTLFICGKEA